MLVIASEASDLRSLHLYQAQLLCWTAELQRRILERMRSFGMTPVFPAFAGFVPPALAQKRPGLNIIRCALQQLSAYALRPTCLCCRLLQRLCMKCAQVHMPGMSWKQVPA